MSSKDKRNLVIGLLIWIFFAFVCPCPDPLTKEGIRVVGVFLMTVYWWTVMGVGWPSVICLYMLATTGIQSADSILAKSWGHGMTAFLAFCLIFNYAMAETGLSKRLSLFFVTRKCVKGRPWLVMYMFFFSILLVSLVVTSSAVGAMFLGIAEQMFENTGYKKGEELPEATVSYIAWIAQAGQGMTPMSHAVTLLGISLTLSTFGIEVSVLTFCAAGLVMGIAFFLLFMICFRFGIRPNVEKMANLDIDYLKTLIPKRTKQETVVTAGFIALIVMWVCPDILELIPFVAPVGTFLSSMGAYMPALLVVGILAVVHVDGKPVIDLAVASKKINWVSVYMMASLMCLATIVGLPETGITAWITETVGPLLSNLPPLAFIFVAVGVIGVMTNFMSNTVSAAMHSALIPIAMAIPGCNPIALGLCIASIANFGFATPAACPVVGMVAGTDWVRPSFLLKYGWFGTVCGVVTICCIAYPIWSMIFPYVPG